jgi:hypothetical protein
LKQSESNDSWSGTKVIELIAPSDWMAVEESIERCLPKLCETVDAGAYAYKSLGTSVPCVRKE